MKSVLEVDSVQKTYNHKLILSDIYLRCQSGEIVGLLGRNGSGKSTLLKIIFGIVDADYKFVRIDGRVKKSTADLIHQVSYLSQQNFIPPHLKVIKAIRLSVAKSDYEAFVKDSFIDSFIHRSVYELSGGELRYLQVKLVLSNQSKFVLLDEPYSGLSPIMVDTINLLLTENAASKGIVITDHNYENIFKISDRVLLMHDGRTLPIGSKEELTTYGYLR